MQRVIYTDVTVIAEWDGQGGVTRTVPFRVHRVLIGDNPLKGRSYLIGSDDGQDFGEAQIVREWKGVIWPGEIAVRQTAITPQEWQRVYRLAYQSWQADLAPWPGSRIRRFP